MKHHDDLINRLQKAFNKEYNHVQIEDIKEFLERHDVSEERCGYLYSILTDNNAFLPKKREIKDAFEQSRSGGFSPGDGGSLHPQSPCRMILEGEKMSCDDIVKYCRAIRKSYDAGEEVSGRRLSFMANWEYMCSVEGSDREIVKKLILAGDREELYSFLDTAMKKIPLDKILIQRKGKPTKLSDVMKELMSGIEQTG